MKLLLCQYIAPIILMLIFLKGYFPIQQQKTVIIDPPTELSGVFLQHEKFYKPQIDRLVLIIIDALRYDFITKENMPFLNENMDCLLKVKVEAPTVTLPRIKALTTGAVPQFIDIVLNLGANAKVSDSFIHRAYSKHKKMLFYGDRTWLMMFPDLFARYDGTTSFYVNDFTEVDDNVTRHIDKELVTDDWDIMFLHYLGLDHIGHVRGPFSNLIKPKLHEMDAIINKIISSSHSWDERTMILITGDHGMKDTGGHGGTTYAETHVPLIVHHNKGLDCKSNHDSIISQTDIANTLSALFGIAMPANSIGKVIPTLMNKNQGQLLYTLHYNSIILQSNSDSSDRHKEKLLKTRVLFKELILNEDFDGIQSKQVVDMYMECLQGMSDDLIASSVKQDSELLICAILGTVNCLISLISNGLNPGSINLLISLPIIILLVVIQFAMDDIESYLKLGIILSMGMLILFNLSKLIKYLTSNWLMKMLPFTLHAILLFSSSYIEEEHYIFYYFISTVSIVIAFLNYQQTKKVTLKTAMPLTVIEIIRLARSIDKDWLLKDDNFVYMQIFHAVGLFLTYLVCKYTVRNSKLTKLLILLFCLIFIQKTYFERWTEFAQLIWALILVIFIISLFNKETILQVWILIMAFQFRPYNTILIPAAIMCSHIFIQSLSIRNKFQYLVVIHIWLGYTFFFLQGHGNSIANIDLAPGYIGLSSYNPIIVGALTLCHSYGFQTLSVILICNCNAFSLKKDTERMQMFNIIVGYRLLILIMIYVITFIHRGHLFVWSVFAPKLLIECIHTSALFIQILFYCLYQYIMYLKII